MIFMVPLLQSGSQLEALDELNQKATVLTGDLSCIESIVVADGIARAALLPCAWAMACRSSAALLLLVIMLCCCLIIVRRAEGFRRSDIGTFPTALELQRTSRRRRPTFATSLPTPKSLSGKLPVSRHDLKWVNGGTCKTASAIARRGSDADDSGMLQQ